MSSTNNCIRFDLDIKDENVVFNDYFYKMIQKKKCKVYKAEEIQRFCPYCSSSNLLHNDHLTTNIRYITTNASHPVFIRLAKARD